MLNESQRADIVRGIYSVARDTGAKPQDVAAVIGYETAGTFDPWKAGPTTRWGQHRGLIQWGEPQARQYGVSAGTPVSVQMQAVSKYLRDHGFRPGMGLLDLYSTVNAGRPGLYSASDRPGATVATHAQNIQRQFGDALDRLQGGKPFLSPPQASNGAPSVVDMFAPAQSAPFDPVLAGAFDAPRSASIEPQGLDPREARRRALLDSIGNLFA